MKIIPIIMRVHYTFVNLKGQSHFGIHSLWSYYNEVAIAGRGRKPAKSRHSFLIFDVIGGFVINQPKHEPHDV